MQRLVNMAREVPELLALALGVMVVTMYLMAYDIHLHLPGRLEMVLKLAVLITAGWSMGMLIQVVSMLDGTMLNSQATVKKSVRKLTMAIILLTFFIAVELLDRLKMDYLSWRTPLWIIAYCFMFSGLRDCRKVLNALENRNDLKCIPDVVTPPDAAGSGVTDGERPSSDADH